MSKVNQAETIENIFRAINEMTQSLIELQEQVVKLKPVEEVKIVPTKHVKTVSPSIIDGFHHFTTELIKARIEDNLIEISYINSGQMTTLNREEIYDIFINLPDTFDRLNVKNCIKNLGIDSKNETLLMRFFIYQFKDHCERTTKGSKDRLVIRKL